jgi:hypothetical protein
MRLGVCISRAFPDPQRFSTALVELSLITLRGHSNNALHFFGPFLTPPPRVTNLLILSLILMPNLL